MRFKLQPLILRQLGEPTSVGIHQNPGAENHKRRRQQIHETPISTTNPIIDQEQSSYPSRPLKTTHLVLEHPSHHISCPAHISLGQRYCCALRDVMEAPSINPTAIMTTYLVANTMFSPVLTSFTTQSRRTAFFPSRWNHVSTSTRFRLLRCNACAWTGARAQPTKINNHE